MGLETVTDVKDRILQVFPRTDPAVGLVVESDFEVWVKALCRIYPWWFNTIRPGSVSSLFPVDGTALDLTTLLPSFTGSGRWFHRGWLVTESGVDVYEFKAPLRDEEPDLGFADAQVFKVHSVKVWNEYGQFEGEIPVRPAQFQMSGADMAAQDDSGWGLRAWLEHFPTVSVLRLHPVPVEERILSVEFVLAACPNYQVDGDTFNRFVSYAPDVVVEFGLMKLAQYFDEISLYNHYREVLYGSPPLGVKVPGSQHGGQLADLREQGSRMELSDDVRLEYYVNANAPYGGRSRRRYAGPGRYWGG